jgi:hypothetical protein
MWMLSLGGPPEGKVGREGTRPPHSVAKLQGITLTLSGAQVTRVLREATGSSGSRRLLLDHLDDLGQNVAAVLADTELNEQRVSYSALRVLSILSMFAPAGSIRSIKEVADRHGISPSTAHRYVRTLVEVGLIEQIYSRKYRIPPPADHEGTTEA